MDWTEPVHAASTAEMTRPGSTARSRRPTRAVLTCLSPPSQAGACQPGDVRVARPRGHACLQVLQLLRNARTNRTLSLFLRRSWLSYPRRFAPPERLHSSTRTEHARCRQHNQRLYLVAPGEHINVGYQQ